MKRSIVILSLLFAIISACHKSSNDPAPSGNTGTPIDTSKNGNGGKGSTGNPSSNPVPVTLRIYRDMDETWLMDHSGTMYITMPGQAEILLPENHTTQFTFCGTTPDATFHGYKDSLYTFTYRRLGIVSNTITTTFQCKIQLKITDANCAYLAFCGENSMMYIGHSSNVQSANHAEVAMDVIIQPMGGMPWVMGDAPSNPNEGNFIIPTYPTF